MNPFVFNTTPQIVLRPGAHREISALAGKRLGHRVLFVTDRGLRHLKLEVPVVDALRSAGIEVKIFDDVEADPSLSTLSKCIEVARDYDASSVVGFGGGSSLDVAKLAALIAGSNEDINDAWGVGNAKGPRLPLVLIPTTAGTGSEVTPVAIITCPGDEKRGVSSAEILPDIAILDAELTASLPGPITAATGIDAMVHAIEAYASKNANNNPISRMLAVEALKLLGANITKALTVPDDLSARSNMLLGSCLAGQAFANSPVAAVHALAYPIGGIFHIPHGLSNALVLPEVLRFNAQEISNGSMAQYARLAPFVFPDLASGENAQTVCDQFIERLSKLGAELGLPARLRDVDIPRDALPRMARDAMLQTRLLVNNPRELGEDDALQIYERAW